LIIPPTTVTPETPTLVISLSGNNVTVSWPATVTGYTLKSSNTLNAPNWQPVAGVANNSVTLPIGAGNQFYALFH
jgi:hypothetical protein